MGLINNIKKLFEKTKMDDFNASRNINDLGMKTIQIDKDTEIELTPQKLMHLAYLTVENHSEIYTGYRDYTNFFIGKGMKSKIPEVNEFLMNHKYIQSEVKKFVYNYLITGNAYVQYFWEKSISMNDVIDYKKLKAVQTIDDSSRIFYNLDASTDEDYWLYSIHYTTSNNYTMKDKYSGKKFSIKTTFYWIKYALGQMWQGSYEYCMPLNKHDIRHFKNEFTRNPYYGHSALMSGWDYAKTLKQIMNNAYIIAKYQATGKKIISVGDPLTAPVTQPELDQINRDFYSEEKQILLVNKPIKVESLTYEGEFNLLEPILEYVRKALMSGSIPTFLTAFADDFNNRSLGDDSLLAFFLNLESERERTIDFWNEILSMLIYGDKVHDCGLYFAAPKAKQEEGDLTISSDNGKSNPISSNEVDTNVKNERIAHLGTLLENNISAKSKSTKAKKEKLLTLKSLGN